MGAFDTSDVSAQGASAVTPKEGAGKLLSFGLDTYQKDQAGKAQAANSAATNAFATQQLDIADAVAQGSISSAEGQRRMRVNSTRALSAGMW